MKIADYDSDSDSLYFGLSSKKAYYTLEISERIGVDATRAGQVVGIEILQASQMLSELFKKAVTKEKAKRVLYSITEGDAINLDLKLDNKRVKIALPRPYSSPVATA